MTDTISNSALIVTLAPKLDQIVDKIANRTIAEIPAYEAIGLAEVREGILRDLRVTMMAFVEEREFSDEDENQLSIIGSTRAEQGLPIESMLRVYRITLDEVFAVLWEAAKEAGMDATEAIDLTRSAWEYAGPAIETAVKAYREQEIELAIADSQSRTALVHGLLVSGRRIEPSMLAAAGLDEKIEYVAFRAHQPDSDSRSVLLNLQMPGVLNGGLAAPYEDDVIGLAPKRPSVEWRDGLTMAVGPKVPIREISRSFDIATRLLSTASKKGVVGLVDSHSMALQAMAQADGVLGDSLVERYVTPLAPETTQGQELIQTLTAFIECDLNAERAAEALFVHANTVRNRLHRIEDLTGASLHSVRDLSEIYVALLRVDATD